MGPTKTYGLTSPPQLGAGVRDLQAALVTNPFGAFYVGERDGEFGPLTAQACKRAKWLLGYPKEQCVATGGIVLYAYLTEARTLPASYQARRRYRLWKERNQGTLATRALAEAKRHVGVKENPPASNRVLFSDWYGLVGPWCAMFVTYCYVHAGSKGFRRGGLWAYCPYMVAAAIAGENGASVTRDPQPGDVVLFDWTGDRVADHVGLFDAWIDRDAGRFRTVEGNTSSSSDSDGGAVEVRERSTSQVRCFMRMSI